MQEQIDMRGQLTLRMTDKTGEIIQERQFKNRIVTSGRELVARLFAGFSDPPPTPVTQMAVGTDGTPAADEQTSLLAERPATEASPRKEIDRDNINFNVIVENQNTPQQVQRYRVLLTTEFNFDEANGTEPLREAAIFNSDGVMYNRVAFQPVTKTADFQLTLLWEIIF
jgi:hypothetical protein